MPVTCILEELGHLTSITGPLMGLLNAHHTSCLLPVASLHPPPYPSARRQMPIRTSASLPLLQHCTFPTLQPACVCCSSAAFRIPVLVLVLWAPPLRAPRMAMHAVACKAARLARAKVRVAGQEASGGMHGKSATHGKASHGLLSPVWNRQADSARLPMGGYRSRMNFHPVAATCALTIVGACVRASGGEEQGETRQDKEDMSKGRPSSLATSVLRRQHCHQWHARDLWRRGVLVGKEGQPWGRGDPMLQYRQANRLPPTPGKLGFTDIWSDVCHLTAV